MLLKLYEFSAVCSDKLGCGLHVFCPTVDSSCGESKFSPCNPLCGKDVESKILAPQYFHKPSFRSALVKSDLPGISFAERMETGLLTFEIFYFKINKLSAMA